MPYLAQVAVGRLPILQIYGDDYETRDGTGERDYIHVVDLARAHVASLDYLKTAEGHDVINVGTGQGVTVLELVEAFERKSGVKIPRPVGPRREGDAAASYAEAKRARVWLGWEAQYGRLSMGWMPCVATHGPGAVATQLDIFDVWIFIHVFSERVDGRFMLSGV